MTAYLPGRPVLSLQQQARARRYVDLYRERFGRDPRTVPETVYLADPNDHEELT